MCEEDDWFKSALFDDSMVAELLIQFRESVLASLKPPVLLEWGVRQPRSRQILRYDVVKQPVKKGELTRASPTTPLSWSAGTSNSGGGAGDGYEESSVRLTHARSKLVFPSDKRSRKKKTFAQLKEEEILLSKEAIHLKRAIRSERTLYQAEKVRNDSLKRLKQLDLQLQSPLKLEICSGSSSKNQTFNHSYQANAIATSMDHQIIISLPARGKLIKRDQPLSKSFSEAQIKERAPVLPDLNMLPDLNLPFDEDFQ